MSGLRVIAGKARGRRLRSVPGDITRPITDRVKESLFNILGPDIAESIVLDLFAGTGSVGIEALSRGAKFVRFVDRHHLAVKTVRANLESTGLGENAEVLKLDAFALLKQPPDYAFDYIYVAPPQYQGLWKKALKAVDSRRDWLSEDSWVVVQIDPVELEPLELENLVEFDQRRYGSTLLIFYTIRERELPSALEV
jgi:16S rRNA (guanine966-N2)-methyltransferase